MQEFYDLTITNVRDEANEAICVEFACAPKDEDTFNFTQGQYLTFIANIEGQEIRRSYSICSGVGEPLAVAIKKIQGGAFSQFAHQFFKAGTTVKSLPPDGKFNTPLDAENAKNYLCIAAGSGITPILSIATSIMTSEPNSRVTLLYGNRRSTDIIFREQLLWLKNAHLERFQWINIFSQEKQSAPVLNGHIDNKKGAELNQHLINIQGYDEFFLCGPEGMISEVSRGLRAASIDESHIHYELFFASAEDAKLAIEKHHARARQYAGLNTQVRVRSGGREVEFDLSADGENILDGAMHNGLDLPFSCKGGVCATCKAKVLEGEVEMDLNHALSIEEVAQGYVLTCQAHPISKQVTVDFDCT